MKQDRRLRWGILGTSMISNTIAEAIQASTFGEVHAVYSRSESRAAEFAKKYQIPTIHTNAQQFLADQALNVIYIGLPNHLHAEWIKLAANANKAILCEKPFTTTLADAKAALDAVNAANVFCMEALMYRCHPFITALTDLIRQHVIGKIISMNAVYFADIAKLANPVEGGSIMNLGCYPVSLIRLLMGADQHYSFEEPIEIIGRGRINAAQRDHQTSMIMHFSHDRFATVTTADDCGMYHLFEIYGSTGMIRCVTNPWLPTMKDNRIEIHDYQTQSVREILIQADKSLYTYQIEHVNQQILQGDMQSTILSWQDSLGNVTVLENWLKQVQVNSVADKQLAS